jgi:RNA polymerase sigma factor (sigma-70 family)
MTLRYTTVERDIADRDPAALLAAAGAGDRCAWREIVDRYVNLVWSVARSFRLAEADAADVAQATWLRLVQHLHRIQEPDRLGAWLATTARREALALRRRNGHDLPVAEVPEPPGGNGSAPDVDDRVIRADRHAEIRAAVDTLPGRCRQLLRVLLADPPPTYEEVSAATGMPVGSVGPTRQRCLETLRARLTEPGGA